MSAFHVEVVRLGPIERHPDADTLEMSVIYGDGGYNVVFKENQYVEGDLVVYIPVDAMVPLAHPLWDFLRDPDRPNKTHERIKAKKLRGIFSQGMLVPAEEHMSEGDDVADYFGITKFEVDELAAETLDTACDVDRGYMNQYTDMEPVRKYKSVLAELGGDVVITEKINGTNARFTYRDGRLWCGSHRTVKKNDGNIFHRIAEQYSLETVLTENENFIIYGEVYGNIPGGFVYDAEKGTNKLLIFDIFDTSKGRYVDWDELVTITDRYQLPRVPLLYRGALPDDLVQYSNGPSVIGQHIREGCVVKPETERWHRYIGRVILKLVGEDYLLKKK